jgi:hypothetical protein
MPRYRTPKEDTTRPSDDARPTEEEWVKLAEIRRLVRGPNSTAGKHFICVRLNLDLTSGEITFGIKYKSSMGEVRFRTLDECIVEIGNLRRQMGDTFEE